eukprot:3303310-Heterocapsa_arctica.AAC.1
MCRKRLSDEEVNAMLLTTLRMRNDDVCSCNDALCGQLDHVMLGYPDEWPAADDGDSQWSEDIDDHFNDDEHEPNDLRDWVADEDLQGAANDT